MNPAAVIQRIIPRLYEDDAVVVVDKPAGIDVGRTARSHNAGLIDLLEDFRADGVHLEPLNRLSRFESGVLILAKTLAAAKAIKSDLRSGRRPREYIAVAVGTMRSPKIVIESGGKRAPRPPERKPKRRAVRPDPRTTPARTTVQRVREGKKRTLVRCTTGVDTTHALRAQLRGARLRVIGDRLHDRSPRKTGQEETCLHLSKLILRLSGRREPLTLRSRPPAGFGEILQGRRDWERFLQAALVRRLPCFTLRDTNAYRLLTGDAEGLAGLSVERYGPVGVFQVREDRFRFETALPRLARWYQSTLNLQAVYVKRFVRDRLAADDELTDAHRSSRPLAGTPVDKAIQIREHGLTYSIRPYGGFAVGLFLDHRDNRQRIRDLAEGKRLLNLFGYTCGFSVAAAAGGASETVSVDLSPNHLAWGRTNFELNGLDPTGHGFVCADAIDYLTDAKRSGEVFDIIVLDPPTFAHGRKSGRDFQITRDLPRLVAASADVLAPGGVLMVSTSYRRMTLRRLRECVSTGGGSRRVTFLHNPRLPIDFAVDPDHAKTVFARMGRPHGRPAVLPEAAARPE